MMTYQQAFTIHTPSRGMINITDKIRDIVLQAGIVTGVCHVFLHHTSASLVICENSDMDVQDDMETFMRDWIPDADPRYKHILEGPDDMASHVRTMLTQNNLTFPVTEGKLNLGTWQGIYLWEHRINPHERKTTVTVQG